MFDGWFIIANPASNSGKGKDLIDLVLKMLDSRSIKHKLNLTRKSGDEIGLVELATRSNYKKMLAIGGDGTVQKVVAGIVLQKNIPRIPPGYFSEKYSQGSPPGII